MDDTLHSEIEALRRRVAELELIVHDAHTASGLCYSETLDSFIDHVPAAVAVFDTQMRYICTSRRFLRDYHLSQTDVVGRSHYEIFPDIPDRWRQIHRRCLAGAVERCDDDPFPRADGGVDWVRWEICPWYDHSGEIGGIILFSEVMTDRKRSELALEESERRFRTIVEHSPEGIFIQIEGRFAFLNPAACRIFGVDSPEDLIGTPVAETTQPESREKSRERIRILNEERRPVREPAIFQYPHRDGTTVWAETLGEPIEYGGKPAALIFMRDVTQQVEHSASMTRLNARLEVRVQERTAQLTAANRELAAFSHTVSHDLRAPLRSLDGYAKRLYEQYAGRLDGQGRHFCEAIQASSQKMRHLIEDLLAFSQVQSAVLHKSWVDMDTLARSLRVELGEGLSFPAGVLQIEALPGCFGDPVLLRQVLTNLLANALKFSAKVEHPVVRLSSRRDAGGLTYLVEDNGVGFDMADRDKLFVAFQRLHAGRDFEGTGLGLSIVERIVSRHSGMVGAESGPGKGATFWFSIPDPET